MAPDNTCLAMTSTAIGAPAASADDTTPLTINAAFLQEIKEDDAQLRRLVCDVRVALKTGSLGSPFVELLSTLREQLALHFHLEEAYGYFADPITAAPELSVQVDALLSDHRKLLTEISRVVEEASDFDGGSQPIHQRAFILQRVRAFCDRLQDHERRESDWILRAYQDDVGVGD